MGKCLSRTVTPPPQPRVQRRGVAPRAVRGPSRWTRNRVPPSTTWKTTIPFVPPIRYGRVIKVYDGDTITVASVLPYKGSSVYRFSVRLNGIDTPEMRTSDEGEKAIAVKAKLALKELINGRWVRLENTGNDKYGRLLADVWSEGIHVNEWMIENRFAVRYDGGTKVTPADWEVFHRGV
jgi:endonuclease YncB( thermonuclease family)